MQVYHTANYYLNTKHPSNLKGWLKVKILTFTALETGIIYSLTCLNQPRTSQTAYTVIALAQYLPY